MGCDQQRQGEYELFVTSEHTRILRLDDDYFAVVQGQQGEMLVVTDSDKQKERTLQEGHYKLVEFEDDAKFQDQPHLFLREDGQYRELVVPRGLPGESEKRNLVVWSDTTIGVDELESYLESPEQEGAEPVEDYFELTADEVADRIEQMEPAQLENLEDFERKHKNRKTVLEAIRRRQD